MKHITPSITLFFLVALMLSGCAKKPILAQIPWNMTREQWKKICPDSVTKENTSTCKRVEDFEGVHAHLSITWGMNGTPTHVSFVPAKGADHKQFYKAAKRRIKEEAGCSDSDVGVTAVGDFCKLPGGVAVIVSYKNMAYIYARNGIR